MDDTHAEEEGQSVHEMAMEEMEDQLDQLLEVNIMDEVEQEFLENIVREQSENVKLGDGKLQNVLLEGKGKATALCGCKKHDNECGNECSEWKEVVESLRENVHNIGDQVQGILEKIDSTFDESKEAAAMSREIMHTKRLIRFHAHVIGENVDLILSTIVCTEVNEEVMEQVKDRLRSIFGEAQYILETVIPDGRANEWRCPTCQREVVKRARATVEAIGFKADHCLTSVIPHECPLEEKVSQVNEHVRAIGEQVQEILNTVVPEDDTLREIREKVCDVEKRVDEIMNTFLVGERTFEEKILRVREELLIIADELEEIFPKIDDIQSTEEETQTVRDALIDIRDKLKGVMSAIHHNQSSREEAGDGDVDEVFEKVRDDVQVIGDKVSEILETILPGKETTESKKEHLREDLIIISEKVHDILESLTSSTYATAPTNPEEDDAKYTFNWEEKLDKVKENVDDIGDKLQQILDTIFKKNETTKESRKITVKVVGESVEKVKEVCPAEEKEHRNWQEEKEKFQDNLRDFFDNIFPEKEQETYDTEEQKKRLKDKWGDFCDKLFPEKEEETEEKEGLKDKYCEIVCPVKEEEHKGLGDKLREFYDKIYPSKDEDIEEHKKLKDKLRDFCDVHCPRKDEETKKFIDKLKDFCDSHFSRKKDSEEYKRFKDKLKDFCDIQCPKKGDTEEREKFKDKLKDFFDIQCPRKAEDTKDHHRFRDKLDEFCDVNCPKKEETEEHLGEKFRDFCDNLCPKKSESPEEHQKLGDKLRDFCDRNCPRKEEQVTEERQKIGDKLREIRDKHRHEKESEIEEDTHEREKIHDKLQRGFCQKVCPQEEDQDCCGKNVYLSKIDTNFLLEEEEEDCGNVKGNSNRRRSSRIAKNVKDEGRNREKKRNRDLEFEDDAKKGVKANKEKQETSRRRRSIRLQEQKEKLLETMKEFTEKVEKLLPKGRNETKDERQWDKRRIRNRVKGGKEALEGEEKFEHLLENMRNLCERVEKVVGKFDVSKLKVGLALQFLQEDQEAQVNFRRKLWNPLVKQDAIEEFISDVLKEMNLGGAFSDVTHTILGNITVTQIGVLRNEAAERARADGRITIEVEDVEKVVKRLIPGKLGAEASSLARKAVFEK